jgi:uncharacterized protein (TIGR02145 family)
MYLGMSFSDANRTSWRGANEGSNLAGYEPLWKDGILDSIADFGTSGFMGVPGGYRDLDGSFAKLTEDSHNWTSSLNGSNAWRRNFFYSRTDVSRHGNDKAFGFSARCLKDD